MWKQIQAKHIPDGEILALMRPRPFPPEMIAAYPWIGATTPVWLRYELEQAFPEFTPRVVLAKCRALIRRGLITGCACGCRGDFERA